MALFWQQFAFLGHDIGHNSVTELRKNNLFWGIFFGNTTGGISLGWWKRSHNVHHIVPNSVEDDPDIQHLPVFAVDSKMFGKFWSTYHSRYFITDSIARFFVSYQHILFYPIMALARFNLYLQGWLLILNFKEKMEYRLLEACTLLTFITWYSCLLGFCLEDRYEILCYLFLSHGLAGILHVQICISHFAEEIYSGLDQNYSAQEWFEIQLKTTMNVDCSEWMDWFHGGLQFQVEHHLFPRMPRHNLRECRTIVKAFLKKWNMNYEERDWFACNLKVLKAMKKSCIRG